MSETILELTALREIEEKNNRVLGPDVLVNRAGSAAANFISKAVEAPASVTVLCGPGNNGADGYVCALRLAEKGYKVNVVQVAGKEPKTEQGKKALADYEATGAFIYTDPYDTPKADVVVDAIFGVGLNKELKNEFLDAAMWFNERQALHVSLDIPTGLDSQTGTWVKGREGCRADMTITFLAGKIGLFTAEGPDACGLVHTDNLGVSIPLSNVNLIEPKDFLHVIQPRRLNTSKQDFGRVGVIGGGKGTVGAAIIAARSALTMGAGCVFVELVEDNLTLDVNCPELMFKDKIDFSKVNALVVGPGLGFSAKAKERLTEAIDSDVPLVLDADALTMIAEDEELLSKVAKREAHTVITPHAAEAGRILGMTAEEVNQDRLMRALDLSVLTGAVSVLKGVGTVIAQRSSRSWINPTGTPALSTAGSGDALSGMLAAMFAQKFELMTAVISAVYLHGAASEGCDSGMLASDIAPAAAYVLQEMRKDIREAGIEAAESISAHSRVATHNIYSL